MDLLNFGIDIGVIGGIFGIFRIIKINIKKSIEFDLKKEKKILWFISNNYFSIILIFTGVIGSLLSIKNFDNNILSNIALIISNFIKYSGGAVLFYETNKQYFKKGNN